jgi:hypothetical protein
MLLLLTQMVFLRRTHRFLPIIETGISVAVGVFLFPENRDMQEVFLQ